MNVAYMLIYVLDGNATVVIITINIYVFIFLHITFLSKSNILLLHYKQYITLISTM